MNAEAHNVRGSSACFVGDGELTLQCAQIWLAHGASIAVVISREETVAAFASDHNIPCYRRIADYLEQQPLGTFDFLFSVINTRQLDGNLLDRARLATINYHNSPLPAYAGLHVTSWAIQNQETEFGITWHEITDTFDAGDIFLQRTFAIDDQETAYTLALKCHQNAADSFTDLLAALDVSLKPDRAQDLKKRSVYLSTKRPKHAAVIDWQRPASEICALVRGLDFGSDQNPLGVAKLCILGQWYVVAEAQEALNPSNAAAGSIVDCSTNALTIAALEKCVCIIKLTTLQGEQVDLSQIALLVRSTGANTSSVSLVAAETALSTLSQVQLEVNSSEAHWLKQLQSSAIHHPYEGTIEGDKDPSRSEGSSITTWPVPAKLAAQLASTSAGESLRLTVALYCTFIARVCSADKATVGVLSDADASWMTNPEISALYSGVLPLTATVQSTATLHDVVQSLDKQLQKAQTSTFLNDLVARTPGLQAPTYSTVVVQNPEEFEALDCATHGLVVDSDGRLTKVLGWKLTSDADEQFFSAFFDFASSALTSMSKAVGELVLISESQQRQFQTWNNTQSPASPDSRMHQQFVATAKEYPEQVAVCFRDQKLTYRELEQRSNLLAQHLVSMGASSDKPIGIYMERSIEMLVAMLAILRAGAAYLPLDPAYPEDRIEFMARDSGIELVVSHSQIRRRLELPGVTEVDANKSHEDKQITLPEVNPEHVAYLIYTSGSTGTPKGVVVEHRNLENFLQAMDEVLDFDGKPGVWLAVTSISFDISVLELLWTVSRGFKVVLQEDNADQIRQESQSAITSKLPQPINFGLFYFANESAADAAKGSGRYRLLLEGAEFADQAGFSAVWTPERHFHEFGGLYPNPSVVSAAIAAKTKNINIRAGSVVLPLHNPVRVAEEWSVVDNLSDGRVGFSFASGWHANDFVLAPENYPDRKAIMFDHIELIRKLWQGESIDQTNGEGNPFSIRLFPTPVQPNPPIWITTAGNIDTFRDAGKRGYNVLTNLLGQSIEDLTEKLAAYRQARVDHGHVGPGNVSVMVHTFVGQDLETVREVVRKPFTDYLKSSFDLVKIAPWAFPAFSQPSKRDSQDSSFDANALTDEDLDALVEHAFDRYFGTAGIFGTPDSCVPLLDQLKSIGVNEVACLIDFGVDETTVLEHLPFLDELRQRCNPAVRSLALESDDYSIASQLDRHDVSHFQCTPSMARILSLDSSNLIAMKRLSKLLLGGEALPQDLAATMDKSIDGTLINVYGPTETTIWSTSAQVKASLDAPSIGRPIANTNIYILNTENQLLPPGYAGELCIGGKGVVRGYWQRPDLTQERFIQETVPDAAERIYRTGDLVAWNSDGTLRFLGRLDNQVKLSGYRIELGEIEAVLNTDSEVKESVVVALDDPEAGASLAAYVLTAHRQADQARTESTLNHWQQVWDETYKPENSVGEKAADPTLNTAGWLDSISGEQHSVEHMLEWAEDTCRRIQQLVPKRILEIGCGTGMLLTRLAPHCEHYVGVDFSETALSLIQAQIDRQGIDNVTLVEGAADNFELDGLADFDLVIINSVIQYFPSASYFETVFARLQPLLAPKRGRLFIGDVRHSGLLEHFHTLVEQNRSAPDVPASSFYRGVDQRIAQDAELLFAPAYFQKLAASVPAITGINIQLKGSRHWNEMSCFRYDVMLTCEQIQDQQMPMRTLDINDMPGLSSWQDIEQLIRSTRSEEPTSAGLVLRNVPNARLASAQQLVAGRKTHAPTDLLSDLSNTNSLLTIEPFDIVKTTSCPQVELHWAASGSPNQFDVQLRWSELSLPMWASPAEVQSVGPLYVDPAAIEGDEQLFERLRALAKTKLPQYMVPSHFVRLDAIPYTPNGKIDRKALPDPQQRTLERQQEYVAPTGEIEEMLATIFKRMLNLEQVGTKDNFFDLGINSLLIVQCNNKLSQQLGRKIPLVNMYRYPTVAALASYLSGAQDDSEEMSAASDRGQQRKSARRQQAQRRKQRKT